MEISNKTLAWLVVAAIVVSILGTTLSVMNMTASRSPAGYATSNTTGEARVDVSTAVVLRFQQTPTALNSTNFGSGSINTSAGYRSCNMAINSTSASSVVMSPGCGGFDSSARAMLLENVGTSNLNVTLNFSKNESDFLTTNPTTGRGLVWLKYTIWNGTGGGCKAGTTNVTNWGTWADVVTANATNNICGNMSWTPGSNTLMIGLNISINENATTVAPVSLTVTAQGTSI